MRALVACEFSGRVREALLTRGIDAYSCDLLDTEIASDRHIKGDVLEILSEPWDLLIAHPPCTRLANSGSRWLQKPPPGYTLVEMWDNFRAACDFYLAFRNAKHIPRRAIENPIMHKWATNRLGKIKRHIVQPWQFGDEAFKAVGWELHGLPPLVPTNVLEPPIQGSAKWERWSAVHREAPGPDRWKNRSRTYPGMAEAIAMQWGVDTTTEG